MNERLSLYNNPAVDLCRTCLLHDFCGAVPKRLSEVIADLEEGNADQVQCDECQLSQVNFDEFITALYIGAMLGDQMGDI